MSTNGFTFELESDTNNKEKNSYLAYFKDAQKLVLVFCGITRLNLVYNVHHSGSGQNRRKTTDES